MTSHICQRVHFVWSTSQRQPLIRPEWEPQLWSYLGAILNDKKGKLLVANGTTDHIHLYVSLPAILSIAEAAQILKANSSRWIRETFNEVNFYWQNGYGAFSVSPSRDEEIRGYIQKQKEHHKKRSYHEEYLEFLERHKISYDPKYVFA